jgi:protein gp37
MKKTKIDWCDTTVNPVIGCKNNCAYCYARKMNDRFKWIKNFRDPQFFPGRLLQLYSKKPKAIFMDSMSDVAFWAADWKRRIFDAVHDNPQHNYIFLTKRAEAYNLGYKKAPNIFLGVSVTKSDDILNIPQIVDFFSIEPILEPVRLPFNGIENIKQIIIGAETGNRSEKIVPRTEWVTGVVAQADARGIRVFMKESLRGLTGGDFRQDPLPWAIKGDGDE